MDTIVLYKIEHVLVAECKCFKIVVDSFVIHCKK